jgi:hypothetical protein
MILQLIRFFLFEMLSYTFNARLISNIFKEKKCVAYPQEVFLITVHHRTSRWLKTNQIQNDR